MVTELFDEQLKWFARKLIEIRVRDIDGYHTPIDLDPAIIMDCTTTGFNTADKPPKDHAIHMLTEIRGEITKMALATPVELSLLSFKILENGHIEIAGFTTELLRIYFEKAFGESSCLFGEGQDNESKTILTYCERDTNITIRGKELAVFRCLLRNFNKDVSFEELFGAIRVQENLMLGRPDRQESRLATETEKTTVRSAVNEVEKKLKKATEYRVFPEIIKSVWGIGYKLKI